MRTRFRLTTPSIVVLGYRSAARSAAPFGPRAPIASRGGQAAPSPILDTTFTACPTSRGLSRPLLIGSFLCTRARDGTAMNGNLQAALSGYFEDHPDLGVVSVYLF